MALRVDLPVEAPHEQEFALAALHELDLRGVDAAFRRQAHRDELPQRRVRRTAAVLQLGDPELALVQHGQLRPLAAEAGAVHAFHLAGRLAAGTARRQVRDHVEQLPRSRRLEGELRGDVVADLDGPDGVAFRQLQALHRVRERRPLHLLEQSQAEAFGAGVAEHTEHPALSRLLRASTGARERQAERVQRERVATGLVGLVEWNVPTPRPSENMPQRKGWD